MPTLSNSELGPVLGLDYGTVRIGVAVSDSLQIAARPLAVLTTEGFAAELGELTKDMNITRVIVGLPFQLSGLEGESAAGARKLAKVAGEVLATPVGFADERYTSVQAEELLKNQVKDRKDRRAVVDATAAAIMLQGWLDSCRSELELPARYRALDVD